MSFLLNSDDTGFRRPVSWLSQQKWQVPEIKISLNSGSADRLDVDLFRGKWGHFTMFDLPWDIHQHAVSN